MSVSVLSILVSFTHSFFALVTEMIPRCPETIRHRLMMDTELDVTLI